MQLTPPTMAGVASGAMSHPIVGIPRRMSHRDTLTMSGVETDNMSLDVAAS